MIEKIMNKLGYMKLSKIKIYPSFEAHKHTAGELADKICYYIQYERFEQPVVVNCFGYLTDGYTTYLIAKDLKHKWIKVKKSERS